jgi:hypothetical protein
MAWSYGVDETQPLNQYIENTPEKSQEIIPYREYRLEPSSTKAACYLCGYLAEYCHYVSDINELGAAKSVYCMHLCHSCCTRYNIGGVS